MRVERMLRVNIVVFMIAAAAAAAVVLRYKSTVSRWRHKPFLWSPVKPLPTLVELLCILVCYIMGHRFITLSHSVHGRLRSSLKHSSLSDWLGIAVVLSRIRPAVTLIHDHVSTLSTGAKRVKWLRVTWVMVTDTHPAVWNLNSHIQLVCLPVDV